MEKADVSLFSAQIVIDVGRQSRHICTCHWHTHRETSLYELLSATHWPMHGLCLGYGLTVTWAWAHTRRPSRPRVLSVRTLTWWMLTRARGHCHANMLRSRTALARSLHLLNINNHHVSRDRLWPGAQQKEGWIWPIQCGWVRVVGGKFTRAPPSHLGQGAPGRGAEIPWSWLPSSVYSDTRIPTWVYNTVHV